MLAQHAKNHPIRTSEGQFVSNLTITIEGVEIAVLPLDVAAIRLGYTPRYVRKMCNTGALIAIKISGRWYVSELALKTVPQKERLLLQHLVD